MGIAPGAIRVCVALYEYQDEDETDDSRSAHCAPGFRVDILEETNPDWHKGVCQGKTGFYPSNYLEDIPETGGVLQAVYDYTATQPDEMSITAGQVLFRLEDLGNGWVYGKIKNTRGLVPATYVKELEDFK
eukprot:sb/3475066/